MVLLLRLGFDVTQRSVEPPRICLGIGSLYQKPRVSQSRVFPCVSGSRPLCLVVFVQDADVCMASYVESVCTSRVEEGN
jgi:hypothetical protein